jgi:hypothetical protein
MVSEAISSSPTTPSDGVMGAVATLCNFDIFNGNYTSAKVHMAGLLEMVKLRGGLQHLGPFRSFLPTLVSWYVFAVHCARPEPAKHIIGQTSTLSPYLVECLSSL